MTDIFLTSDHHFFHGNIIKYCNRPFENYDEMNEFMIKEWNKVVSENDIVVHLGDFAWRDKAKEIRPKLNGTIILIRGNHDNKINSGDGFIIVEGELIIDNLILTHEPLLSDKIPIGFKNIHGHIHHKDSYFGINISVEKTNYQPVNIKKFINPQ